MAGINQAPAPSQTGNVTPEALPDYNTQITTNQQAPQVRQPVQQQQQPEVGSVNEIRPKDLPPDIPVDLLMTQMKTNPQHKQEQHTSTALGGGQPGNAPKVGHGPVVQQVSGPGDGTGHDNGSSGGEKPEAKNKPAGTPPEEQIDPKQAVEDVTAIHENRASAEQRTRFNKNMNIPPEQTDKLQRGEQITVPRSQMDYMKNAHGTLDKLDQTAGFRDFSEDDRETRSALANSLQVASNPRIHVDPPSQNAYNTGGWNNMPASFKERLGIDVAQYKGDGNYVGIFYSSEQSVNIAQLINDGDKRYKVNTDLDRKLLEAGRDYLDLARRLEGHEPKRFSNGSGPYIDQSGLSPAHQKAEDWIAATLLNSVRDDREAVITAAENPETGQDFVRDVVSHPWPEYDGLENLPDIFDTRNSADATVENSNDPADVHRAQLSGRLATAIFNAIGSDDSWKDLSALPGDKTAGQANPKMMQALARTMAPYAESMAGGTQNNLRNFDYRTFPPELLAKGRGSRNVFAILNTDAEAGRTINAASYQAVLKLQTDYGSSSVAERRSRSGDLSTIGTLKALVDTGTRFAEQQGINNTYNDKKSRYELKAWAYDMATSSLGKVAPASGDIVGFGGDKLKESA